MDFGDWNVQISYGSAPQPVATAISNLNDIVGAEYELIAYLGSQEVNGINYAALAKQILTTGRDTENIVVLVFNQRPSDINATLVSIEHVLDSGNKLNGIKINVTDDIPIEAQEAWTKAREGYVGFTFHPIALLGSQVAKGKNYFFFVEGIPVMNDLSRPLLISVNAVEPEFNVIDILETISDRAII